MKSPEPQMKFGGNWPMLAALFNYDIGPNDQDWPYQVSEAHRVEEYIAVYEQVHLDEQARTSLIEMILQGFEMRYSDHEETELIQLVTSTLARDFEEHAFEIYYWCCWGTTDVEGCFAITPLMRGLWSEIK